MKKLSSQAEPNELLFFKTRFDDEMKLRMFLPRIHNLVDMENWDHTIKQTAPETGKTISRKKYFESKRKFKKTLLPERGRRHFPDQILVLNIWVLKRCVGASEAFQQEVRQYLRRCGEARRIYLRRRIKHRKLYLEESIRSAAPVPGRNKATVTSALKKKYGAFYPVFSFPKLDELNSSDMWYEKYLHDCKENLLRVRERGHKGKRRKLTSLDEKKVDFELDQIDKDFGKWVQIHNKT